MINPQEPEHEYVLAEHSNEALRIVLRNGMVYKHLRGHDCFRDSTPEKRLRQLRLRVAESQRWPELNPMTFDEETNCIVSPFVEGRVPLRSELFALRETFQATGRGYIEDIGRSNVLMVDDRPVMVDFVINESHPDFHLRYGCDVQASPSIAERNN